MRSAFILGTLVCGMLLMSPAHARAEPIPKKYQDAIDKGLKWIASQQDPIRGNWAANNGRYPVAMTALAGMSLLMEGSTLNQGKYAKQLRKTRDWLVERAQPNGLIGDPRDQNQAARYMYGHGFSMLFLSSVFGSETDRRKREELKEILTRAAKFTREAQTNRGGWGYVSAKDGNQFDEGSVTITQVQALRAARNAGIPVPPEAIKDAVKYLQQSTNSEGGIIYSLSRGGGSARPALTAAAIACAFGAGEYDSPLVKKWLSYCKNRIPLNGRIGHQEYTHYYYAQALYVLGNDGYAKLFPDSRDKDPLTWENYRKETFDDILRVQTDQGYFTGGSIGPVYVTAIYLTILQLDKAALPIYQR